MKIREGWFSWIENHVRIVASVYSNHETAGGEIDMSTESQHALSSLT
jgi:hypothetical protein